MVGDGGQKGADGDGNGMMIRHSVGAGLDTHIIRLLNLIEGNPIKVEPVQSDVDPFRHLLIVTQSIPNSTIIMFPSSYRIH